MEGEWVEEIKRHFGVIAESLRDDIKLVAEGHDVLRHSIEDPREGVKEEFNEVKPMIKLSYAELEHRITTLEKSYKDIEKRLARLEAQQ